MNKKGFKTIEISLLIIILIFIVGIFTKKNMKNINNYKLKYENSKKIMLELKNKIISNQNYKIIEKDSWGNIYKIYKQNNISSIISYGSNGIFESKNWYQGIIEGDDIVVIIKK